MFENVSVKRLVPFTLKFAHYDFANVDGNRGGSRISERGFGQTTAYIV